MNTDEHGFYRMNSEPSKGKVELTIGRPPRALTMVGQIGLYLCSSVSIRG